MQAQGVINFVWNKTFDIFVLTEQKILIFVQHHDLTFPPFLLEEKLIVYTQPLNLLLVYQCVEKSSKVWSSSSLTV